MTGLARRVHVITAMLLVMKVATSLATIIHLVRIRKSKLRSLKSLKGNTNGKRSALKG